MCVSFQGSWKETIPICVNKLYHKGRLHVAPAPCSGCQVRVDLLMHKEYRDVLLQWLVFLWENLNIFYSKQSLDMGLNLDTIPGTSPYKWVFVYPIWNLHPKNILTIFNPDLEENVWKSPFTKRLLQMSMGSEFGGAHPVLTKFQVNVFPSVWVNEILYTAVEVKHCLNHYYVIILTHEHVFEWLERLGQMISWQLWIVSLNQILHNPFCKSCYLYLQEGCNRS